jgi:hypothetical protein
MVHQVSATAGAETYNLGQVLQGVGKARTIGHASEQPTDTNALQALSKGACYKSHAPLEFESQITHRPF